MNEKPYDAWEAAENATVRPSIYFGQITFDIYAVVFQKGVRGGIPYNEQVHKEEDRRTLIKVVVTPLASANVDFVTERDFADFADEWVGITLRSIKVLIPEDGALRELNGKWIKYKMVKYGTYIKNGEEKDLTTYEILDFYGTEEAAEAAASALYGNGGNGDSGEPKKALTDKERARNAARPFLPALAKQAEHDPTKMAELLANNSVTKDIFTISDPEVIELLTPEAEEVPF